MHVVTDMRKARNIVEALCKDEGVTVGELMDAPHTRSWIAIRTRIGVALREETSLSYKEIGLILGYRSRPTKQIRKAQGKVIHKVQGTTTTKEI